MIFSQPLPLISFKRYKNICNFLVRSVFQASDQHGTLKCARALFSMQLKQGISLIRNV